MASNRGAVSGQPVSGLDPLLESLRASTRKELNALHENLSDLPVDGLSAEEVQQLGMLLVAVGNAIIGYAGVELAHKDVRLAVLGAVAVQTEVHTPSEEGPTNGGYTVQPVGFGSGADEQDDLLLADPAHADQKGAQETGQTHENLTSVLVDAFIAAGSAGVTRERALAMTTEYQALNGKSQSPRTIAGLLARTLAKIRGTQPSFEVAQRTDKVGVRYLILLPVATPLSDTENGPGLDSLHQAIVDLMLARGTVGVTKAEAIAAMREYGVDLPGHRDVGTELFVDPDSALGKMLARQLFGPPTELGDEPTDDDLCAIEEEPDEGNKDVLDDTTETGKTPLSKEWLEYQLLKLVVNAGTDGIKRSDAMPIVRAYSRSNGNKLNDSAVSQVYGFAMNRLCDACPQVQRVGSRSTTRYIACGEVVLPTGFKDFVPDMLDENVSVGPLTSPIGALDKEIGMGDADSGELDDELEEEGDRTDDDQEEPDPNGYDDSDDFDLGLDEEGIEDPELEVEDPSSGEPDDDDAQLIDDEAVERERQAELRRSERVVARLKPLKLSADYLGVNVSGSKENVGMALLHTESQELILSAFEAQTLVEIMTEKAVGITFEKLLRAMQKYSDRIQGTGLYDMLDDLERRVLNPLGFTISREGKVNPLLRFRVYEAPVTEGDDGAEDEPKKKLSKAQAHRAIQAFVDGEPYDDALDPYIEKMGAEELYTVIKGLKIASEMSSMRVDIIVGTASDNVQREYKALRRAGATS